MDCSTCNNIYLPEINRIYYAVASEPFNYLFTGNTVVINDEVQFYRLNIQDLESTFEQEFTTDANGVYYTQSFNFVAVDFNQEQVRSLKSKSLVFIFLDNNSNWLIAGYDEPFSIDSLKGTLDKSNNTLSISLSTRTYQPIRPVKSECWFGNECCPELSFEIETTPADTPETPNGTITVNVSGGTGNYLFKLDRMRTTYQVSNVLEGLSGGTYTVFVKDVCVVGDCVNMQSVVVPANESFTMQTQLATTFDNAWRVQGSNGMLINMDEAVTAHTQSFPIFSSTLATAAYKNNNGGLAQGDGTVTFKQNGVTKSIASFEAGDNVGGSGSPKSYVYTGITDGDLLTVDIVEEITDVVIFVNNLGVDCYVDDIRFNGVSIDVTSGSFPVYPFDVLNGRTDETGSVTVEVDISYATGGTRKITAFNVCQSFTTSGTFTFIDTVAVGESVTFSIGNGAC